MIRIPEIYNKQSAYEKWDSLPGRIFLDSNIVKYLLDFGEFIFDNYRENQNYFLDTRGRLIRKENRLYTEIEALKRIFYTIDRANFEFAISKNTFKDLLSKKPDERLLRWIKDLHDHWQSVIESYKKPFSKGATLKYSIALQDSRLGSNVSRSDRDIILDAIKFDCDALLTVDRFADEKNQKHLLDKYQIVILWPTDFIEILGPFQALYNG